MYYPHTNLEAICYEPDHISAVIAEIQSNFQQYFYKYLDTVGGTIISEKQFHHIAESLGCTVTGEQEKKPSLLYKVIIHSATNFFQTDTRDKRDRYIEIMNADRLEEYEDDPNLFKNTALRNDCPVIRMTLQNRQAKELDKYRMEFAKADPMHLLSVVENLNKFKTDYIKNFNVEKYNCIKSYSDMNLEELDTESYIAYGVIGGGIKSHLLYMSNPDLFPNRSREAIWALWFLTNKNDFDCSEDSEFLMINKRKNIVNQNYFYPYSLFSYYAYIIYQLLNNQAKSLSVPIDESYKYVYVDSFLKFVANLHSEDINILRIPEMEDGNDCY